VLSVVMALVAGSALADLRCCIRFGSTFCLEAVAARAAAVSTKGFYSAAAK